MARTERHRIPNRTIHNREAIAEMPEWLKEKNCPHKKKYMAGKRIQPKNLTGKEKLTYMVDECFLAYNSARLREACQLFSRQMLAPDVTIGMSISGALTPAGLGCSSIIPLIKAGVTNHAVSADWTPAAGDVKIQKDGGGWNNVTNLPTATAAGNAATWAFALTATEMQAAVIEIEISDAATKAVEDDHFQIEDRKSTRLNSSHRT